MLRAEAVCFCNQGMREKAALQAGSRGISIARKKFASSYLPTRTLLKPREGLGEENVFRVGA